MESVLRDTKGGLWSITFFKKGYTVTGDIILDYWNASWKQWKKKGQESSREIPFRHDNAPAHISVVVVSTIPDCGSERDIICQR